MIRGVASQGGERLLGEERMQAGGMGRMLFRPEGALEDRSWTEADEQERMEKSTRPDIFGCIACKM